MQSYRRFSETFTETPYIRRGFIMNHQRRNDNNDDDEADFRYGGGGGGGILMVGSSSPSTLPNSSPPSSAAAGGNSTNCILHHVSKFDTLAGVAIKYGVEVADIKRLNGLVTDLQMFALKTIQIPLPGRHPPSPILPIDAESPSSSKSNRRNSDVFDSFQSLKLKSSSERKPSPAISSLLSEYGLSPLDHSPVVNGFGKAENGNGGDPYPKNGLLSSSAKPMILHRKSKSAANGLGTVNGALMDQLLSRESENGDRDKWIVKLLRRRQKSEADFSIHTPEKLLKEDNTNNSLISPHTGKGLALRPNAASRTSSGVDGDLVSMNPVSAGSGDYVSAESSNGVRKSSSTPILQDQDNSSLSCIWQTTKWSLKPDFLDAALPIFDGIPKSRKSKAALD